VNLIVLCIALATGAVFGSYLGVMGLRRWASKQMLDVPNERSLHSQPTPRGGGVAIVTCTLVGVWMTCLFSGVSLPGGTIALYSLGAAPIALVSWYDDLRSLTNSIRFATQSLGALLVLIGIGFWRQPDLPFVTAVPFGWLGFPITFLWIVGFTNAYNFMDGIDGIAGGQALIAGSAWALLGILTGSALLGVFGALLAGSSLGFLRANWPPARIFMGDVGSAFLGYTLACLPMMADSANPRLPAAGVLVVWPFVLDSSFTLVCRLGRGENVFAAHRSHLYQRLVIAGYSHHFVTLLYMSLAMVGAILAIIWVLLPERSDGPAFLVPLLLFLGLWLFVVRSEHRKH
jgi:UDP-N-acetylmuramyl pentapeptide phosphotransferase/UDP-N-acetylglucosamine-1-phosphate transferase